MSLSFKPKSYLRPRSEVELSSQLQEFGDRAKIIAGGTGIYEVAHRGLFSDVDVLIDINDLNLSHITMTEGSLNIGTCVKMRELSESKEISTRIAFSGIMDALRAIQPLQVKNVATIGGAVCTALPFLDLPVSFLSLDAEVCIGPSGKLMPLSEFVIGYFELALAPGEFVKQIELPFSQRRASAFQKFAVTHDDWALINCGASLSLDRDGKIVDPRIYFGGGVGNKPSRSWNVERALSGIESGRAEDIKEKFERVADDIEFVSDIRASAKYRQMLAKVIGYRTVISACERVAQMK